MSSQPPPPPTTPSGAAQLAKTYAPAQTEPRITQRWDSARVGNHTGAFHADPAPVLEGERQPYSIVIPPPNVTAALHLGHALNNTIQDILARAHRMMGFETLWMPGTDHAGIATQAVVEKRVWKEEKKRRTDFTREAFVEKIQAFKDEYEATITAQLKVMGCSCDWERQRFTMDDQCAAAVREAFFQLFRDGLIYRGKRLVNWDPELQTAVADDECEDIEIDAHFYYLRYPLVQATTDSSGRALTNPAPKPVTWSQLEARGYPGASQHPPEQQAWITVATTRPETYLGDVAVGMNPHDPRYKAVAPFFVDLPLVGRILPIIKDEYVVLPIGMQEDPLEAAKDPKAQFASGFLKVTPAHDQNDYDLYFRHKQQIDTNSAGVGLINVMAPNGAISDKHGWTDVGDAHIFVGLSREAARKKVLDEFYARGLLEETKPYKHTVKHSDRSKAAIEPYLSDQWFVKVTDPRMAQHANAALAPEQRTTGKGPASAGAPGDGALKFYPARYAKTYELWHDNIRDWCISRQLWWGHRIPVWSGSWTGIADASEIADSWPDWEQAAWLRQKLPAWASSETEVAISTRFDHQHRKVSAFICLRRPNPTAEADLTSWGFVQDSDVLDTWFSSALWPLSTMGWPNPAKYPGNEGMLEAFNPTNVLCTAREIITLWVSRMVMFNRYFLGEQTASGRQPTGKTSAQSLPFRHVFIHAMIQDGEGRKMSKSLGNGVDPRDIVESHGADAMRFTLCHMTTQTQDVRMPVVKDSKTGKNTSPKFDMGRNFCNKLWNASRFALGILSASPAGSLDPQLPRSLPLADRWLLSRLEASIRDVNAALSEYQFSAYAQAVYDILWRDFCDWYLEAIKPTAAENPAQRAVLRVALDTLCRLLHPITPFVTEAIWENLQELPMTSIQGVSLNPSRIDGLLCGASWPVFDASVRDEAAERDFERARSLITAIREVRSQHQVQPKRRIMLHAPAALMNELKASGGLAYVESLAGLEQVLTDAPAKGAAKATLTFDAIELHLTNLADAVDAGAEKDRLTKDLADKEKAITTIAKRLENPGYVAKAPPKLVEESKAQMQTLAAEVAAIKERLATL